MKDWIYRSRNAGRAQGALVTGVAGLGLLVASQGCPPPNNTVVAPTIATAVRTHTGP